MALDPSQLSKRASTAIFEAKGMGQIHISEITLWEVAMLAKRRRIAIRGSVDSFVHELSLPVVVKPITAAIAAAAVQFPENYPKDPADRLIGATSKIEGLKLVTADAQLRRSSQLDTIW